MATGITVLVSHILKKVIIYIQRKWQKEAQQAADATSRQMFRR